MRLLPDYLTKEFLMEFAFYLSAFIAVISTVMVITRRNAVHGVLYLIVSLLALAIAFYVLGAPFAAALEVIVYAGAIMVLFVFVIMILNVGEPANQRESQWLRLRTWIGPLGLTLVLLVELLFLFANPLGSSGAATSINPKDVGISLFGPYLLAVEIASMLLLSGLVGAYHIGRSLVTRQASQSSRKSGETI